MKGRTRRRRTTSTGEIQVADAKTVTRAEGKKSPTGLLAWLMDEAIPIPGTKTKIGLDPLLGVLPASGDFICACVSCVSLVEALRRGLSVRAMWKMVGNILMNAGFGAIPIVGDLFSVFFRSNSRNRDIIRDELERSVAEGRQASWGPVFLAFGTILIFLGVAVVANLLFWALLAGAIGSWLGMSG